MADMVIVGGGVYGCGLAWRLSTLGYEVQVLEAGSVGCGASSGPGRRGVRANARDRRELALMRKAYEIWPTLHKVLDARPFYERTGHLLLVDSAFELSRARAICDLQNAHAIPSRLITGDEARAMEPALSRDVIGAVFCPLDGVADHSAATFAYRDAALRNGVVIAERTAVKGWETRAGRVDRVLTECGAIPVAHSVWLLANAGVETLLRVGKAPSVHTWNSPFQVLLTQPVAGLSLNHLLGHLSRTVAIKAATGGRVMISGGYPGRWNEARQKGEIVAAHVEQNLAHAVAVVPSLAGVEIECADAGHLESVSVDDIPTIDEVPGLSNVYFAAGWSGHGWAIAPAIVEEMTDWVRTGKKPAALEVFGLRRFQAGTNS